VTHSAARDDASLSLTSRTDRSGYVISALRGELGIASAPALREQLLSLLGAASHLIIDLSAVEHADSSGLAVLMGGGRRARLLGGSLRLAAPSPEVAGVLSTTGMNQHFDIYPTVRAAIIGQPRLPEATSRREPSRLAPVSMTLSWARLHDRLCLPSTWRTDPAQVSLTGPWRVSNRPRALPARSSPRASSDRWPQVIRDRQQGPALLLF
jgi:anti-sigma B factor antagonist